MHSKFPREKPTTTPHIKTLGLPQFLKNTIKYYREHSRQETSLPSESLPAKRIPLCPSTKSPKRGGCIERGPIRKMSFASVEKSFDFRVCTQRRIERIVLFDVPLSAVETVCMVSASYSGGATVEEKGANVDVQPRFDRWQLRFTIKGADWKRSSRPSRLNGVPRSRDKVAVVGLFSPATVGSDNRFRMASDNYRRMEKLIDFEGEARAGARSSEMMLNATWSFAFP